MNRKKNNSDNSKRRPAQMLLLLTVLAYPLLHGLTNFAASATRMWPTPGKTESGMANTSVDGQNYLPGDIKVLAEGFHSKITRPFVAVVRDAETYAALIKLDENLPKLDADFFKENVIVAAFLGERNTGGYSVEIRANAIEISVLEKKPGKGAMVPQMITSPFKMVAVQGVSNVAVRLMLDEAWRQRMPFYKVTNARFTMGGGIAGVSEEFGLQGLVAVLREGNLVSFSFRIVSSETRKRRLLMEYSTGLIDSKNKIEIKRMSADSLINPPNNGLQAEGRLSDGGKKLLLNLSSRPSMMIADGYSGQGSIEADLGASATRS